MPGLINDSRLASTAAIPSDRLKAGPYLCGQLFLSVRGAVIIDAGFGSRTPAKAGASVKETDEISAEHLMLWLSCTKPITAVAIAQQHEKRKLHWDDAVSKFIPEFAANGKEAVTIRHLLTHTAGFRSAD